MRAHPDRPAIGVDLGGTNIVCAAVTPDARIIEKHKRPTEVPKGVEGVVANIKECIREVLRKAHLSLEEISGIGIGSPGPLNTRTGIVVSPANLTGWRNVPLRKMLEDEFKVRVVLDNDANAAAYAEKWAGAGKGVDNLVVFTLGTGVGGGIIIDGKLLRGPDDTAGEVGHCTIDYNGYPCKCGNRGCLETYVSATGIVRRTIEAIRKGRQTIISTMVDGDLDRLTSKIVHEALEKGDQLACEIFEETGRLLGAGIANIINTLNPEMIVISGGVIQAGEHLFGPTKDEVRRRAFEEPARTARIVPARLGGDAGVIGAAGILLQQLALEKQAQKKM
jgi:glucokinase